MKENADLTGFWLAWRQTCSIRRCLDAAVLERECRAIPEVMANVDQVVRDAQDVIETTNGYFARMIRSPRAVKALKRFATAEDEADDETQDAARRDEDGLASREDGESSSEDARTVYGHLAGGPSLGTLVESADEAVDPLLGVHGNAGIRRSRGKMISEYRDLVTAWSHRDEGAINAFELVEIDLYREAAAKTPEAERDPALEPRINGKKVKDYLFEDICARTGNISGSLWGYLLKKKETQNGVSRLRMVANASFRNPVEERRVGKDGDKGDQRERPDTTVLPPSDEAHIDQARAALHDYWRQRWDAEYDVTDRVALCCAFLEYTMTDPFVVGLVTVKMSAFNARKQKRVGEAFSMLKGMGFSFDDVRYLFQCGKGQRVLREIVFSDGTRDPVCKALVRHFDGEANGGGN